MFNYFANPTRFLRLANALMPFIVLLTLAILTAGLYLSLTSPADYQQGETVKIMYIHVPAALMGEVCYIFIGIASAIGLIFKHPLADYAAKNTAPIGATFTFLALFTGSFWGKPMWGTWWVWDARLTSTLIMFLLYLGYISLWQMILDPVKAARTSSILALVGVVNVFIIKFSVEWWNTLHQPSSIMKSGEIGIKDPHMLWALFTMIFAYGFIFLTLLLFSMRAEIYKQKIRHIHLIQTEEE